MNGRGLVDSQAMPATQQGNSNQSLTYHEEVEKIKLPEKFGSIGDGLEARHEEGKDAAARDDEEVGQVGQGEGEEERTGRVGPHLVLPHEKRPLARDVVRRVA